MVRGYEDAAGASPAPPRGAANTAYRLVVAAGFLFMLGVNLPGHLSYDSVVQLLEGRSGVRNSFAPGIMSWLLGRFDSVVPGTGLYVTAVSGLMAFSLLTLKELRPRTSWLAVLVAAGIMLTPTFMIYQAIVWKDVLFANVAIAGFMCLALGLAGWRRPSRRWLWLGCAVLLMSLAALVRQNGFVAPVMAAAALGWTLWARGWRTALGAAAGFLILTLIASQLIGAAVQPRGSTMTRDTDIGVRTLQNYDILGALKQDPKLRLDEIARADPSTLALIRRDGPYVYSAERIDFLSNSPSMMMGLWHLPKGVTAAQWKDLVLHHTGAYLGHRIEVFHWLVAPPVIDRCLPVWVGIDGPPNDVQTLNLTPGQEPQDIVLANYASWFYDTPLYSHVTWGVLAGLVALALLWRRQGADIVVAAMLVAAMGFAASFFVISIACDYRYLYFLDLAAMTGLLYLALDPPLGWPRRRRPIQP